MGVRVKDLAAVFSALADPTRLRILALLGDSEVCVCHIHDALRLPQPTVSRHLAYLRRAGLVEARRQGLWAHYRLVRSRDGGVQAAVDAAIQAVGHVSAVRMDHRRLTKRTIVPAQRSLPVSSCCAPAVDDSATVADGEETQSVRRSFPGESPRPSER